MLQPCITYKNCTTAQLIFHLIWWPWKLLSLRKYQNIPDLHCSSKKNLLLNFNLSKLSLLSKLIKKWKKHKNKLMKIRRQEAIHKSKMMYIPIFITLNLDLLYSYLLKALKFFYKVHNFKTLKFKALQLISVKLCIKKSLPFTGVNNILSNTWTFQVKLMWLWTSNHASVCLRYFRNVLKMFTRNMFWWKYTYTMYSHPESSKNYFKKIQSTCKNQILSLFYFFTFHISHQWRSDFILVYR